LEFQRRCEDAVRKFVDAYPERAELRVTSLTLRYIDAIPIDIARENVFDFLREKMKTTVALPGSLFQQTNVSPNPTAFNWQAAFRHAEPAGTITVRFATGQRDGQTVLVWETLVVSEQVDVPTIPDAFPEWLEAAHNTTDDWFFKLIEGDLERRFEGD